MIYLDYQATTPLAPEAREAMLRWLDIQARGWLWLVAIGVALALSTLLSTWPLRPPMVVACAV